MWAANWRNIPKITEKKKCRPEKRDRKGKYKNEPQESGCKITKAHKNKPLDTRVMEISPFKGCQHENREEIV